jgi:hypothetical protein
MIEHDRLLASALGEIDDDEVEEHVLACGACAALYASFVRLGSAIAVLVRSGGAMMPVTRALKERLEAERLVTRRYELQPGKIVPCTVTADDIYSLSTYHAPLDGVLRLDLVRGEQRLVDIPFDAPLGRVYMLMRADMLRRLPSLRMPLRLVAVAPEGERTIGEYALQHTAFVP